MASDTSTPPRADDDLSPIITARETPTEHDTTCSVAPRTPPIGILRAKALLRHAFGGLDDAGEVLERLAEALRLLDDTASDVTADETSRNDTGSTPARARKSAAKR